MLTLELLEKDKVQKKWKNFPHQHGVYLIEMDKSDLRYYNKSSYVRDVHWSMTYYMDVDTNKWILAARSINVKDTTVQIIGRFKKIGQDLYIVPEEDEKYAYAFN